MEDYQTAFSNKGKSTLSITLNEDGQLKTDGSKIAEILNHYSTNITENLGISKNKGMLLPTNGIGVPVEKPIKKYENHPSVTKIKERRQRNQFEVKPVTINEMFSQMEKLNLQRYPP